MSLSPGARLGVYEVISMVGRGGMGEVYRAVDTDLKRSVAIKMLPDGFVSDADRLARFQREAEILASLNHPHIAHVYGLEKSGGRLGLVMELVEGPTLAERIKDGPLAVDEALVVAQQIAEALETAHDRGVIHRDLKPANIKVRPDGRVKVLDFGLAKLAEPERTSDSVAATASAPFQTREGAMLGTPAYMAPEQITGSTVDRRADIWAFGCVLYEMLTATRAFDGASVPEMLAAVLGSDPDWSRLPVSVPTAVRRLLRGCLVREPRQRLSHLAVARYALEEHDASPTTAANDGGRRTNPRFWVAGMIAAALLAAAITASAFVWLAPQTTTQIVRTTIVEGTFTPAMDRTFAITPDGTRLAFVSSDATEIRVRPLDALDSTTILDTTAFIHCLFASPDGQWIGYVENNYTLTKIPIAGGATVRLLTMDGPARGASWGPGDAIVFATGEPTTGLQRISARGGPATVLTRPVPERGEGDHVNPVWLPDGRGVLFTVLSQGGGLDGANVAVFDMATGAARTLIEGGYGARYVAGGYLVYAAAGALWATRFDGERLETQGSPVKVLPRVTVGGLGGVAHFDVSANGTLVYPRDARDYYARSRVPVWVDRDGRETAISATPDSYLHPRLSPDGTRLAVVLQADIYLLNLARPKSPQTRLTFTPGGDWFPVWTPDGRRIVFGSWRGGGFSNLYVQDADAADAVRLTDSPDMQLPTSISPDGKNVVFHSFPKDVQALRLGPPHEVRMLAGGARSEERNGALSPDGRWLAYEGENTARPGTLDLFVRPFPDVERGAWQVTNSGGTFPAWSRTGRELYYLKPDGTMVALSVDTTAGSWRTGIPVDLFRGPYLMLGDGSMGRHYDVASDGRFLMLKDTRDAGATPAHFVIVQSWIVEVKRLLRSGGARSDRRTRRRAVVQHGARRRLPRATDCDAGVARTTPTVATLPPVEIAFDESRFVRTDATAAAVACSHAGPIE